MSRHCPERFSFGDFYLRIILLNCKELTFYIYYAYLTFEFTNCKIKIAIQPYIGKPRRMRVDRKERWLERRRLPPDRPNLGRSIFLLYNNLIKPFMDSLLTHKHFYVNLMIGKRVIRLHPAARQ